MEHINNQKFQTFSNQELSIITGGKWITYYYDYRVMTMCDDGDYGTLGYKTFQIKYNNQGNPVSQRDDK